MMIRRHNKSALLMHWFNAVCFIFLLFTGFALLSNDSMQPIGMWWSAFWTAIFGETGLLYAHVIVGLLWAVVYLLYIVIFLKTDVIPFLREIFRLNPVSDVIWCVRKTFWLLLSTRKMRRLELNPDLPPQGFYNAGQKMVAIAAIGCGVLLAATGAGLALAWAYGALFDSAVALVQWALLIHMCCAGLMAVLLPIHIYMAAAAPGERPALKSMFTGYVPLDFIKHHNPLWYESLPAELKDGDRGIS